MQMLIKPSLPGATAKWSGTPPLQTTQLPAGNAWIACDDGTVLAIEAMAASSVLAAMADGTLLTRCHALKAVSPWAYLLIAGTMIELPDGRINIAGDDTNWQAAALQGLLLSVQELGVAVVTVRLASDVPATLERLAKRTRAPQRINPPREATLLTPAEQLLGAIPGLGPERIKQLLTECTSAAWALCALTAPEPTNLSGIGPKTQQAARQALGLPNNMFLSPIVVDTHHVPPQGDPK